MTWQRRARLVLVAVAVSVSAAVLLTTRRRQPAPAPPAVHRVDPTAVVESSGAYVRDVKGERESFRVEAARQLMYDDGRSKLMEVTITIAREGKTYVLTGDETLAGRDRSSVQINGHAHLRASDGFTLDAESASYSQGEGMVRAPGAVTFSRGTMRGSGVGFTYDVNHDSIGLADRAAITFAPNDKDPAGAAITAGAALIARKEGFVSLERRVHILRGRQTIDAERAVADLTDDQRHISGLDLNGAARIVRADAEPGGLESMAATNLTLAYAENSEFIQHAALAGASSITLAGEGRGVPARTLAAESIDVTLAEDGSTVTGLTARDRVALDMPAPRRQPSKAVRSAALSATGEAGKGLTAAVFSGGVEYRESGGAPPVQRLVRSRALETALDNGFAEIREARFSGGVQFNDGSMRATAANIRYDVPSGSVDLTGAVGGARPRVVDEQVDVSSGHIEMTLAGPKLTASDGPVRTLLKPAKPRAGGDAARMPGLMRQDQAVSGSSDRLVYDGASGSRADFAGAARLFQGDTLVQADSIAVDGKTGNLTADGHLVSRIIVNDADPATKAPIASRAAATAGSMAYDDAARSVKYASKAHVTGPQGDVTAETVVLTLAKESQDVQRLEATAGVTLRENGRTTTGDRLLYSAEDESYTMTGKVARMIEANCRENVGTTLRFEKSTDKLRIDGIDDSRMQSTKAAPGCVPRPE